MSSCAATRAADALLRSLGGANLSLRLPANITSSGAATELGLAAPIFDDVAVSPVVIRSRSGVQAGNIFDLLVAASAIAALVQDRNFDSADALFAAALGFVYNGDLLRIESVTSDDFAGSPYLYRITVSTRNPIITQP
jgi:hypothetical protein